MDHESYRPGRQFLQIPGPTNLPQAVMEALGRPLLDHRGPEFAAVAVEALRGLQWVARTDQPVVVMSGSGTLGWEAALVNTLSPNDRVLLCGNGFFASKWGDLAQTLGLEVTRLDGDWRRGPDPEQVAAALAGDTEHRIKAVLAVHNETSTGVAARIPQLREAIDAASHPALLIVDAISSLGSLDYRHDEWGVDVTVACSQKGLMLPPGLAINVVSERALAASSSARFRRGYVDWAPLLGAIDTGQFPFTPASSLVVALRTAIDLLRAEGLPAVFDRHDRHAEATRRAVRAWGLEVFAIDPCEQSGVLTTIVLPDRSDASAIRGVALDRLDLVLGAGLGKLATQTFRIGHLGDFNDVALCGTLAGVEIALRRSDITLASSGLPEAIDFLTDPMGGDALAMSPTARAVTA
jgi:alanine-glyoxylate transaminase / serine-glyoxylate transaminase / serine-pyruvate transaminase